MVNYPNKKTSFVPRQTTQANRGMTFERILNETNLYYREHDIAMIYKKPIPIQIVKVDYPSRSGAVIREAYYKVPSTTDYNGLYKGRYIDFEAKETKNKTSFPLKNIHPHQIEHLLDVHRHGGIAFVLIHLRSTDDIYFLKANDLAKFYDRSKRGRKSISFVELRQVGYRIDEQYAPRVPYLTVVDALLHEQKE